MELYNANDLPLSSNQKLKEIQEKILRGSPLSLNEYILVGKDETVKNINGYKLKPDHAYMAVNEFMLNIYTNLGYINNLLPNDEYEEKITDYGIQPNHKGINWYLGGASLKYGDFILECPAYKDYFRLTYDNGNQSSFDPTIKLLKSSGTKKPVPISLITNVIDIRQIKEKGTEKKLVK